MASARNTCGAANEGNRQFPKFMANTCIQEKPFRTEVSSRVAAEPRDVRFAGSGRLASLVSGAWSQVSPKDGRTWGTRAESVAVRGATAQYAAGDVLVIDGSGDRRLALASEPYSTLVAGIYSTKPGVMASPHALGEMEKSEVPLAVVGIVPSKVTASNGAIGRGDLLVTSAKSGFAMKGTDRTRMVGAIVGKALQPLPEGEGVIQVLVTLQ